MQFQNHFLRRYLDIAPAALAIERSLECELMSEQKFERPILDLGCGDGVFAKILFAEPVDVGVDIDPEEIERARRMNVYHELITAPGDSIPKADGSFPTIFSNSVLEHIPNLEPVLVEAHRLLAPSGRLYVTIPTDRFEHYSIIARILDGLALEGLSKRFRKFYNSFWRHYHAETPDNWVRRFESVGFRAVETRVYNPKPICTLNDLLMVPATPALISKKLLNRWIAFPGVRHRYSWILHAISSSLVDRMKIRPGGGLVFLALTKDN